MSSEIVVLDANIGVFFAWPTDRTSQAHTLVRESIQHGRFIVVPELWKAEVVSSLRKWAVHTGASREAVRRAVDIALSLPSEAAPLDRDLCLAALKWAERLNERVIYDACYLALAERLSAEFWTADARLYRKAVTAGASFVRLLDELSANG